MSIASGSRLGPYEILELAGSGGMGDVYRARDVRLDRDVAVKTIKGPFTERFEREARAISSLNHPNICTLFDVGEHDGSGYLVMEFLDGKPIAGPLPIEQAVAYGVQICEALHAAHRKGIVHRDLKPANILITRQGIKLLDFGLAKLADAAGTPAGAGEQATVAALTGVHTVVGTPQYMAPEQIEARQVDARTDIFAFGCVLYELLTGQRAFDGKTASSVMAAVLATEPKPIEQLLPLTPPALDRIVSRCLAKDPEDRWQSARDVAAELTWVSKGGSSVGLPPIISGRRRVREGLAWGAFAVAALSALGFAAAWTARAPAPGAVIRFPLITPAGVQNPSPPVVSPDGRTIAFAAESDGGSMIWIRPLDALEARPVPGTEGVYRPFWSPDSRSLAFIAGGKLKRVDISGGPAQTICDTGNGGDGSWSPAGVILFDGQITDPLRRVSAAGGIAEPVVLEDGRKEGTPGAGWPEFLPDGRHFLYTADDGAGGAMTLKVGDLDSSSVKTLFKTTTRVQYAEPGYLLYVRERTLVAQPFDARSLTVKGEPLPVGEDLVPGALGLASFSVSRNGVLVFRGGEQPGSRLIWVDRRGTETLAVEGAAGYGDAVLSPDGTRLAYDLTSTGQERADIWIRDLARGVASRFTFDPAVEVNPLWSPDGRQIVFTSRVKGRGDLYLKDISGTRDAQPLLVDAEEKYASDWSRDGRYLLFATRKAGGSWDIAALPLTGDRKPFPVLRTSFVELWATFSPDGKYIAYQSNESGRQEIYVQDFPAAHNKWQLSTDGGTEPFWNGNGRELFYRAASRMMSVSIETGATLTAGNPVALFQTRFSTVTARGHYRPAPDGQRFLVLAPVAREAERPAAVVLNWTSALKP